jgi:hypothetical protein
MKSRLAVTIRLLMRKSKRNPSIAMTEPNRFFRELARLAKSAPSAALPSEPPLGFTTRVLANLRARARENEWARLAIRTAPVGAVAALLSLFFSPKLQIRNSAPESSALAQQIVRSALTQ